MPLHWEHRVLVAEPPGTSLHSFLFYKSSFFVLWVFFSSFFSVFFISRMEYVFIFLCVCFVLFPPCTHFSQMTGSSRLSFHTYNGSRKNLLWHPCMLQDWSSRGLHCEVPGGVAVLCEIFACQYFWVFSLGWFVFLKKSCRRSARLAAPVLGVSSGRQVGQGGVSGLLFVSLF